MKTVVLALALACPTAALAQGLLELRDKWHECLVGEAVRLDDGISPASDIAAALAGKCHSEYQAIWANAPISQSGKGYDFQATFEATRAAAMSIVLMVRAAKRAE